MKNAKAMVGIVLIFALGAACGATGMHMYHRARMEAFIKGGAESREEVIVSRLTHRLGLDSRQQEQVRTIISENHRAMRQVRQQYHPQIQAILDQGQQRIAALLRPDQQEKFRQIIEERRGHHPPWGRGHGPGP